MKNKNFLQQTDRFSLFITVLICSVFIVFEYIYFQNNETPIEENKPSRVQVEVFYNIPSSTNNDTLEKTDENIKTKVQPDNTVKESKVEEQQALEDTLTFKKIVKEKRFVKIKDPKVSKVAKKVSKVVKKDNNQNNEVQESSTNNAQKDNELKQLSAVSKASAVSNLLDKISSVKKYPIRAIKSGTEGQCDLSFDISEDGIVKGGSLKKGSSSLILDTECKRLISAVTGYNVAVKGHKMSVNVPVIFSLND